MTVEVRTRSSWRKYWCMRRISGVRDVERCNDEHTEPIRNTSRFRNRRASKSTGRTDTIQLPVGYLRDECPCAICTGAHGTEPQKTSFSQPQPSNPFQMFKPAPKMVNVEPIGNYAIQIPGTTAIRAVSTPTTTSALFAPARSARRHVGNASRMRVTSALGSADRVTWRPITR